MLTKGEVDLLVQSKYRIGLIALVFTIAAGTVFRSHP